MRELNRRESCVPQGFDPANRQRRKYHVLVEFPHYELESVVVQWEYFPPTMLVQLKRNREEPLQFHGKRTDIPGYADLPKSDPAELEQKLVNFLCPVTGKAFTDFAYLADLVFSARAFSALQPEPGLVLPAASMWECRAEALETLHVEDKPLSQISSEQ